MTAGELADAVRQALEEVDFEPPVSVAYCAALRDRLRELAPGATLDVYFRHHVRQRYSDVVLEARLDGVQVRREEVLPAT